MSTTNAPSNKPHMTIATIGGPKVGKTTLTAAFARVAHRPVDPPLAAFDELCKGAEHVESRVTFRMAQVEYETNTRRYTHLDWPSHADFLKCMLAGAVHLDAAVLMVSMNPDILLQQELEQLHILALLKLPHIVVYLARDADNFDPETEDVEEMETRERLGKHFHSKDVSDADLIVRGDARQDRTKTLDGWVPPTRLLLNALDGRSLTPRNDPRQPFFMPTTTVFAHTRLGVVVVAGHVQQGSARAGDTLEILSPQGRRTATLAGVDIARVTKDHVEVDLKAEVGLRFTDIKFEEVNHAYVVAAPKSIGMHTKFAANLYIMQRAEGGINGILGNDAKREILCACFQGFATIKLREEGLPGMYLSVEIHLTTPAPMNPGTRFVVRDGGRAQCLGIAYAVLD